MQKLSRLRAAFFVSGILYKVARAKIRGPNHIEMGTDKKLIKQGYL